VGVDDASAIFGLPNVMHRDRCEEVRGEVEGVLAAHFGSAFPIRLTVDDGAPAPPGRTVAETHEDPFDPNQYDDAPPAVTSPEERLKVAFPGAEEVPS
jgi:hypothetical protein